MASLSSPDRAMTKRPNRAISCWLCEDTEPGGGGCFDAQGRDQYHHTDGLNHSVPWCKREERSKGDPQEQVGMIGRMVDIRDEDERRWRMQLQGGQMSTS